MHLCQCGITGSSDSLRDSQLHRQRKLEFVLLRNRMSMAIILTSPATQNITATTCAWPYRDQSSTLRSVSLPLFLMATVFIAARVTARLPRFGGTIGSDDYMIVAAWVRTALRLKGLSSYSPPSQVLSVGFTILLWMCTYFSLQQLVASTYMLTSDSKLLRLRKRRLDRPLR